MAHPVRAAGILFLRYSAERKDVDVLLIREPGKELSDIGGKTEREDKVPNDTALRELKEETNNLLNESTIALSSLRSTLYIPDAKYVLFLYEVSPDTHIDIELSVGADPAQAQLFWVSINEIVQDHTPVRKRLPPPIWKFILKQYGLIRPKILFSFPFICVDSSTDLEMKLRPELLEK